MNWVFLIMLGTAVVCATLAAAWMSVCELRMMFWRWASSLVLSRPRVSRQCSGRSCASVAQRTC